jgi:hypothetical protein
VENETVTQALVNALFLRGQPAKPAGPTQLELFGDSEVESFHRQWELDAEREKINRSRFAQRALKPAEVRQELEAADAVLGDPAAVREFVLNAAQRLGLSVARDKRPDVFRVAVGADATVTVPAAVAFALPASKNGHWLISFTSPTPEQAEYLGRNHRFVAALARFLMEEALTQSGAAKASRCGVIRTRAVSRLTTVVLLRIRYLVQQPERTPLLAEEVHATGYVAGSDPAGHEWLADREALRLLAEARPDASLAMPEKRELIAAALDAWPTIEPGLRERIKDRAAELEKSHKRVRQAVALKVRQLSVIPQFPPDLLGILVLQPLV